MPKFNTNQLIDKAVRYADKLTGHTKNKLDNMAHVLNTAGDMGVHGIPEYAKKTAQRLAKEEGKEVLRTRIKTGVGATAAVTGGFLGLHKYHQHKDNKILERIDSIGKTK